MTAVIIDYGSGNLHSALKAVQVASGRLETPIEVALAHKPEDIVKASHIILPGVGAYKDCWAGLTQEPGFVDALIEAVIKQAKPFLGICVGMQMMAKTGFEHGETPGLGWIDGVVDVITPSDPSLKIPHMGWNELEVKSPHPLLKGIDLGPGGSHAYFVHSYAYRDTTASQIMATTQYGGEVIAAVGRDNLFGTQFHPEKSQALGLKLLENFLNWRP